MSDSLQPLSLLFITQLIFTMYGAGLRRPFGSLETIKEAPDWIRMRKGLVLAADLLVVAFLCFMWYRLIKMLDLGIFLVGFFVFAAIGTLLAHRVNLFNSSVASFAGILVATYLILNSGSPAQIGH
ncbi:MAG: hypothetical protein QOG74_3241 [Alphaproteobacteria bacterium]|nr:hypothetical protein [Alphaproteobacteria bacterium]